MRKIIFILTVALIVAIAAAAPALAQTAKDQYGNKPSGFTIKGSITDVSRSAKVIIVEEDPSSESGSAKGEFAIDGQTRILRQQGNTPVPATFEELEVGQTVAATYEGPVAESYPTRGVAGRIVILDDGSEPAPTTVPSAPATSPGAATLPDTGGVSFAVVFAGMALIWGGLLVRRAFG